MKKVQTIRRHLAPLKALGGISVRRFLSHYWQQQPLLARQAFAHGSEFAPLSNKEILQLATYEEAESRVIVSQGRTWSLEHGPFARKDFDALRKAAQAGPAKWTVLVQDTQHFSHEAHDLLQHFAFLPYSRIDDLMVSYASKGGGVGPHFDSYDVFLLQGSGRRRWQISAQRDQTLLPGMPLKILKHFKAEQEWVLDEGDMLYLPPGFAHNGIAESDDCVTWSIGFRAPTYQELLDAYLDDLRDTLTVGGRYADRQRSAVTQPARIDSTLRNDWSESLRSSIGGALRPASLAHFVGRYLTQPKSHVEFAPPERRTSAAVFCRRALQHGIRLDLRSRMMFDATQFYLNGRALAFGDGLTATQRSVLKTLANTRAVAAADLEEGLLLHLHELVNTGEIEIVG